MLNNKRKSKGVSVLGIIAPELPRLISSITPVERCVALAVSNAMLIKGASIWGKEISHQPMKIPVQVMEAALNVLHDQYLNLEAAFDQTHGGYADDPQVSACRWEMTATQVVMVTIGARASRDVANIARTSWDLLWKATRQAEEAVELLQDYSKKYSVDPLPLLEGKRADRTYLMALATNLPPMFRKS